MQICTKIKCFDNSSSRGLYVFVYLCVPEHIVVASFGCIEISRNNKRRKSAKIWHSYVLLSENKTSYFV